MVPNTGKHLVVLLKIDSQQAKMSEHGMIIGFGKGGFKLQKGDDEIKDDHCLFQLSSEEDLVVLNGVVVSVQKVIMSMRATKPDCKVCYHNLVNHESDPKKFTLTQTHKVSFVSSEPAAEINNGNIGARVKFNMWAQSGVSQILWHVRWAQKGHHAHQACALHGWWPGDPSRAGMCADWQAK